MSNKKVGLAGYAVRRSFVGILLLMAMALLACSVLWAQKNTAEAKLQAETYQTAIFAGGCFWCMESDFDKVPGVLETLSGYSGGHVKDPSYEQVSAGSSGHVEVVKITFDPKVVSYQQLLKVFWRNIDPTVSDRQFCDRGRQYRAAIFYQGDVQKKLAQRSKFELEKSKPFRAPIVTEIEPATAFYVAEEYHQNFHKKNPLRYQYYRYSCGRDKRLEQLWGKSG